MFPRRLWRGGAGRRAELRVLVRAALRIRVRSRAATPAKRVRVAPRLARPPHTEHACACAGRADRGPKGRGSHEARLAPPQPGGAAEQTRRHGATRPIHTHTPIHTHQRELVAQVEDGVEAQVGGGEGNEGPHRAARARLGVTPLAHGDGGRGAGPRGWRAGGVGGWAPRRERRGRCVETNAGEWQTRKGSFVQPLPRPARRPKPVCVHSGMHALVGTRL